ncbi:hypothetical protein F4780DRAFT_749712, partial [Xylariomycetidae sp. FL0641]
MIIWYSIMRSSNSYSGQQDNHASGNNPHPYVDFCLGSVDVLYHTVVSACSLSRTAAVYPQLKGYCMHIHIACGRQYGVGDVHRAGDRRWCEDRLIHTRYQAKTSSEGTPEVYRRTPLPLIPFTTRAGIVGDAPPQNVGPGPLGDKPSFGTCCSQARMTPSPTSGGQIPTNLRSGETRKAEGGVAGLDTDGPVMPGCMLRYAVSSGGISALQDSSVVFRFCPVYVCTRAQIGT